MARPHPRSLPVLILLTALASFGPLSIDMYLPSLPSMVEVFGASVSQVQLTLSMFIGGFAFGTLFHGPLADRFGRRPVLLAGCALYCVASFACLFAPSIEFLIVGRFVQAVGGCVGPIIGRAVIRDIYSRQEAARFLSYMASAIAITPAIAPLIGGWLQSLYGWQSNFVVFTGVGCLVLLAVWLMLDETNPHPGQGSLSPLRIAQTFAQLLRSRFFLGQSLTVSLSFACMFSFISGVSFVLIDLMGVPEQYFAFAFICVVAGFGIGGFTAGRLSARRDSNQIMEIGCAVLLIGGCAAVVFATLGAWRLPGILGIASVVAPATLVFFASAMIIPNGTAQAISPYGHMAGAASSLIGFLQMTIGAVAGAMVGASFSDSATPMMLMIGGQALATVVCYGVLVGRRQPPV